MNCTVLLVVRQKKHGLFTPMLQKAKKYCHLEVGKCSSKQLQELMKKLKHIEDDYWFTDHCGSFSEVLPKDKHLIGKEFTKAIEGVNTAIRNAFKMLNRMTVCFSKKLENHLYALKLSISIKIYHTFEYKTI